MIRAHTFQIKIKRVAFTGGTIGAGSRACGRVSARNVNGAENGPGVCLNRPGVARCTIFRLHEGLVIAYTQRNYSARLSEKNMASEKKSLHYLENNLNTR